jgi:hypothetical protein
MAVQTAGQKDALVTASWLKAADRSGELADMLQPALSPQGKSMARVEGWILSAVGGR